LRRQPRRRRVPVRKGGVLHALLCFCRAVVCMCAVLCCVCALWQGAARVCAEAVQASCLCNMSCVCVCVVGFSEQISRRVRDAV
jgi:hypothetical protein